MYLKRIEIAGFKSFADRTRIELERGVTAVVGPNGSGKSNITEAIRWVLGEQSAKNLRGGKMPDIIFAGAEGRKALNIAEVTVVLENSDHFLPLDFTEVSVTRRYRRTGESDFYINKQACRLKDIHDLFMDSGLGRESFSIISQGKVEAIFNSKPEDRRGIFEEAAGVLKYKQRKKKAEQKLFETEDNVNRVQDIIYELEDQLGPLQTQSNAAKEFVARKEQLTKVDVQLTVSEISTSRVIWQEKKDRLANLSNELQQVSKKIQEAEDTLFHLKNKRNKADEKIETYQQQLLKITETLKHTEGQKNVLVERSKHTQQSASELQQTLKELGGKLEQYQEELQVFQQKIVEKEAHKKELLQEIAQSEIEVENYSKSSKELLEELRNHYVDLMQETVNTSNELKYLEKQYQQESAKNQQAIQKHQELESRQVRELEKKEHLSQEFQQCKEKLDEQRQQYTIAKTLAEQTQGKLAEKQKQMYQSMNQVQQIRARQKSLKEIQENYSGFYQGVRVILKHKAQLKGIIGAVAELIEVPSNCTLAIETALGASAQHIVVETENDGREGITFLKQQQGGRATFLPVTTIKARKMSRTILERVRPLAGFLGVASELVRYEGTVDVVMKNLLGTTLIADTLENANRLATAVNYQYRIVSLTGDVMNAGGSMTGGANKRGNQGSLFSQTQELQTLTEQVVSVQRQLSDCEKEVQNLTEKVKQANEHLEELRTVGELSRLKQQELQNKQVNQEEMLERLAKEQRLFEFESRELHQFLTEYQQKKDQLIKQQQHLTEEKDRLNKEMQQIDQESSRMEMKRDEAFERYNQRQADQAVVTEQLAHLTGQYQEKQLQLDEAFTKEMDVKKQVQELNNHTTDYQVSEETYTAQLVQLTQKKEQFQTEVVESKEIQRHVQLQINELDGQLAEDNKQQQELLTNQTQIEVEKNRAEITLDNALHYLQEEYNLTFERASETYIALDNKEAAKQEVKRLKKEIDRLGPINLSAIEQYDQVSTRYEFLVSQRDDLLAAKDQLFETMGEMDTKVRLRFGEAFEAIRQQFKSVFPNMFGGGRAELILTNPEDLLTTGIEIEAQPPGKKLQNLSLLSGGERALTAIALLFSIIRVRPVPFCVLDEVEAALDDANVSRFGQYLSKFEEDTQFIVVTHRKGTMEASDRLYGVTMQESGVSTIVSVRLEEVKEGGAITTTV